MDQSNPTTGSTTTPRVTAAAAETCAECGQPLGADRGIEQFLAKIGISSEMVDELKNSMQNVDIEEYLNTAREYLKTAGDKVKTGSDKARVFTRENPGKVAAGVAVLALGAGLLLNAMKKDR